MSDDSFRAGKFSLAVDREGVTVAGADTVEISKTFPPSAFNISSDVDLVEALGELLSRLTGTDLVDADGIFDFSVHDAEASGRVVGALVVSVSDDEDAIELSGEVASDVSAKDLVSAFVAALAGAAPRPVLE